MVMNNKGTNAYTIRNLRRVKKNAYTRIACVHFASALFAYLRAALYVTLNEHSIIVQNVSASFKAENLWPQWMKMA